MFERHPAALVGGAAGPVGQIPLRIVIEPHHPAIDQPLNRRRSNQLARRGDGISRCRRETALLIAIDYPGTGSDDDVEVGHKRCVGRRRDRRHGDAAGRRGRGCGGWRRNRRWQRHRRGRRSARSAAAAAKKQAGSCGQRDGAATFPGLRSGHALLLTIPCPAVLVAACRKAMANRHKGRRRARLPVARDSHRR